MEMNELLFLIDSRTAQAKRESSLPEITKYKENLDKMFPRHIVIYRYVPFEEHETATFFIARIIHNKMVCKEWNQSVTEQLNMYEPISDIIKEFSGPPVATMSIDGRVSYFRIYERRETPSHLVPYADFSKFGGRETDQEEFDFNIGKPSSFEDESSFLSYPSLEGFMSFMMTSEGRGNFVFKMANHVFLQLSEVIEKFGKGSEWLFFYKGSGAIYSLCYERKDVEVTSDFSLSDFIVSESDKNYYISLSTVDAGLSFIEDADPGEAYHLDTFIIFLLKQVHGRFCYDC